MRAVTTRVGTGTERLTLQGAGRLYGATLALAPVTLRLEEGSVCVVTGANGSGKTTLLRIAAGVTAPTRGTRTADVPALYLRSGDGARSGQTVRQAVAFAAALGGVGDAEQIIREVGLGPLSQHRSSALSSGLRARLTFAVALACRPALVCLDEPTAHLDPEGAVLAGVVVARLADVGAAVLVATHDRDFLIERADARLCLERGHLVPT